MKEQLKELVAQIDQIKEEKSKVSKILDDLKKEERKVEYQIHSLLETAGVDEVKVDDVRIGRKEITYFNIEDWDKFIKWCRRRSIFPIQKRPQTAYLREYLEQHNKLPDGIGTYVKENISIRRV